MIANCWNLPSSSSYCQGSSTCAPWHSALACFWHSFAIPTQRQTHEPAELWLCHSMNRKKKKVGNRMCVVWNRKGRLLIHMTLSRAQLWKWFSKQTLTAVPKPSLIGRERRKQRFQVYFGLMQQLQDVHLLLAFRRLNRCKIWGIASAGGRATWLEPFRESEGE